MKHNKLKMPRLTPDEQKALKKANRYEIISDLIMAAVAFIALIFMAFLIGAIG